MEKISGNICVREDFELKKGHQVIGHKHNFDHTTFLLSGKLLIEVLEPTKVGANMELLEAKVVKSVELDRNKKMVRALIEKGEYHRLTALEDDTSYVCVYPHRKPEPITMFNPGQAPQDDWLKTDGKGQNWVRLDPNVSEVSTGWKDAYQ